MPGITETIEPQLAAFASAYARQRAAERRALDRAELKRLPWLRRGPLAHHWRVKARSYAAFQRHEVRPLTRARRRPLVIADLGAGNGWLSHRLASEGHTTIAIDIRDDAVDGLGAASSLSACHDGRMTLMQASFDRLPIEPAACDIAVFNAALHYSTDLAATLAEAGRIVRPGGRIIILDSPFYADEADGLAMVEEKRAGADVTFGSDASILMSLASIEFLTKERLALASSPIGLLWRRRRVLYPLWYEWRPLRARLFGHRRPSRFDLWSAARP